MIAFRARLKEERIRKLLLSSVGMAGQKSVQLLVSILTVPLIIGYLESEIFGIFLAISNFGQWFIFDNGIAEGVKIRLIRAHADKQRSLIGHLITTGLVLLTFLSILIGFAFLLVMPSVNWVTLFSANSLLSSEEISYAISILIFIMLLNIPLRLLREIQTAEQKGYLFSIFMTFSSLIGFVGVIISINVDLGIPGLLMAQYGSQTFSLAVVFFIYFKNHKDLYPKIESFKWDLIPPLLKDSYILVIFGLSRMAINGTDTFLVNLGAGGEVAAKFALVIRLFTYLEMIVSFVAYPSWPALADAIHKGEYIWVKALTKKLVLGVLIFSAIGTGGLIIAGSLIIELWTGAQIVIENKMLFVITGLYMLLRMLSSAFGLILRAFGDLKIQSCAIIVEAILHIGLGYYWLIQYGIVGFAFGCLVAVLLTRGLILPWILYRRVGELK
ncbi:lipopolysaccharide biosynthesis protein [Salinivibrio costicola]|uniref:lipopolysaccharide biosynthesis protein n=1 Tax=Salinivibrio costicola TaxID=51367 RepID=UPI0003959419|nr:hypothetical protein [Salinivibrio costicola]